jgi:hypothetical protein
LDALPAGGANKQRARLQALLLKKAQPKAEPQQVQEQATPTQTGTEPNKKQKKYMKGAK